jgi:hypothetical protein
MDGAKRGTWTRLPFQTAGANRAVARDSGTKRQCGRGVARSNGEAENDCFNERALRGLAEAEKD